MANPESIYPRWSAQATLGTGDASKTVKAAPGAGKKLVITRYVLGVSVAAAQKVDLEDSSGTVEVAKLASSAAGTHTSPNMDTGIELTTNEALVLKPAAAGPEVHAWVEGYIKG